MAVTRTKRDVRLGGKNVLAYMGVRPASPSNWITDNRAPTANDYAGFNVGDSWIDRSAAPDEDIWVLVNKKAQVSRWVRVSETASSALETLTGNNALAVPGDGASNIDIVGVLPIVVTGNPATHTLSISGGGLSYTEILVLAWPLEVNNGYIANNVGLITFTLPAVAAVGSLISVVGSGAGGFRIAQQAGQQIQWDSTLATTVGVGGYLESTDRYDQVDLICITADIGWRVMGSCKGNITIV